MAATEAWGGSVPLTATSEADVRWVSHPVREEPGKNVILLVVLVAATAAVHLMLRHPAWTALTPLILLLGVYDYVLPTHFALTGTGIERRTLFFRRFAPWPMMRSRWPDAHGVLVSRFAGRSRIEAHRGIYLRFAGNRQDVLAAIDARLAPPADATGEPSMDASLGSPSPETSDA